MAAKDVSNGMDYNAHNTTYSGFIALFKWGTIASLLITAFVIALLVR